MNTYDIPFERNSMQHKVLHTLRFENLSTQQVVKTMGRTAKGVMNLRIILGDLNRKNYVTSVGFDQWQLTDLGRDVCLTLGGEPTPKQRNSRAKTAGIWSRPTYDGTELGNTCMRPGAYDYMAHPSLVSGRRVWYGPGFRPSESPVRL